MSDAVNPCFSTSNMLRVHRVQFTVCHIKIFQQDIKLIKLHETLKEVV